MKKKCGLSLLFWLALTPITVVGGQLPFIDNDYVRARAEAKQRNLPMFVEVWAPW